MANEILTIEMITKEAVRLWKNSNDFIQNIDHQYDDQYAVTGAKIGASLRIRLPNDYTVREGPAASIQDTTETSVTLTLATQKGVDMAFSSAERALSLDDYSKRVLAPSVNNLVGNIAADVMTGIAEMTANFVANTDSGGNTISPTSSTWLTSGAILDTNSAPRLARRAVLDPFTMARTVSSLQGLFNPTRYISEQYISGQMYEGLNLTWMQDQTVIKHVTGSFTAGAVNGAGQTGITLVTGAITGTLNVGDIITIEGVYGVNKITKQSNGYLKQFVITAPAASGATSLSIFPAIIPPITANGVVTEVQYQTVTASPANGATIQLANVANETYIKNLVFVPEAITMATADLEIPKGVHEAHRENFDGVSLRMVTAYDVRSDQLITRLDVLYGYLLIRPEWVVAVGDSVG